MLTTYLRLWKGDKDWNRIGGGKSYLAVIKMSDYSSKALSLTGGGELLIMLVLTLVHTALTYATFLALDYFIGCPVAIF